MKNNVYNRQWHMFSDVTNHSMYVTDGVFYEDNPIWNNQHDTLLWNSPTRIPQQWKIYAYRAMRQQGEIS